MFGRSRKRGASQRGPIGNRQLEIGNVYRQCLKEAAMAVIEEQLTDLGVRNTNQPNGAAPPGTLADCGFENWQFDTLALHAGTSPDPTTGAMLTPIYQTTTYRQQAVGENKGYTYSRSGNPTVAALERRLAALEGAEFCTCYATGLAATKGPCFAL